MLIDFIRRQVYQNYRATQSKSLQSCIRGAQKHLSWQYQSLSELALEERQRSHPWARVREHFNCCHSCARWMCSAPPGNWVAQRAFWGRVYQHVFGHGCSYTASAQGPASTRAAGVHVEQKVLCPHLTTSGPIPKQLHITSGRQRSLKGVK